MASYRQDMPPPGGYQSIDWTKITRKRVSGLKILGGILAMKTVGLVWWYYVSKRRRIEMCQEFDSRIAIMPFMSAESDRMLLKQCIKMRDAEREIMKDVPNWETGKYAGKDIFQKEQHYFDAKLNLELRTHMEAPDWKEKARVAFGFNPRFGI